MTVSTRSADPDVDVGHDATRAAVERFDAAFARRDVDAVMAAMTDDCVFEDTTPPDGGRHEGRAAVRRCWEELFAASPDALFQREELVVAGDRAVERWCYRWTDGAVDAGDEGGGSRGDGHVRGVDVLRVRHGKVAEKYSYVKG